jgi:hypothetical protein
VQVARSLYQLAHAQANGTLRVHAGVVELYRGWVHAVELEHGPPAIRGEDRLRALLLASLDDTARFTDGARPQKRGACTPFHPAAQVRNFLDGRKLDPALWRARAGTGHVQLVVPPNATCVGVDERPLLAFLGRPRSLVEIDEAELCPRGRADRLLTFLYTVGALKFHAHSASPWALLELQEGASPVAIKRAYKRLARELHPDRHPTASADDVRDLERRFAEVSAAYRRLLV